MGKDQNNFLVGRNSYSVKPISIGYRRFGLVANGNTFNRLVVFIEYDSGDFSGLVLGKSDATERNKKERE